MSFQNSHRSREPAGTNSDPLQSHLIENTDHLKENDLEARILQRKQKLKDQANTCVVVQPLEEEK